MSLLNNVAVTKIQLAQVVALLPTVEFRPEWADDHGGFSNIAGQEVTGGNMEEGLVHTCVDHLKRQMFVVNFQGTMHVIHSRYSPDERDVVELVYAGSPELAQILDFEGENVYLLGMIQWFAFFGPKAVEDLLRKWMPEAGMDPVEVATEAAAAVSATVVDGEAQPEPGSFGAKLADAIQTPNQAMTMGGAAIDGLVAGLTSGSAVNQAVEQATADLASNPERLETHIDDATVNASASDDIPPPRELFKQTFDTPEKKAGLVVGAALLGGLVCLGVRALARR